jgi:hypothetical protein
MTDLWLHLAQLITASLHLEAGSADLAEPLAALTLDDWPQLLYHADGHSLTPLLYTAWRKARLLDGLPDPIRQRMAQAYADNARRNNLIHSELLEIDRLLTAAAVPHLLLKGWTLIAELYPDPAQRVLYDHDFLVPLDRAEAGHLALQAAGFRPLPAKDAWVEKHLPALWRNDGYHWDGYLFDPLYPRPVELHLRLWEEGWRGLEVRQLPNVWADAVTQTITGAPMQRLSTENMLIHLGMHFAGHLIEREARLNQLLDLAYLAQKWGDSLDWDKVLAGAAAARVGRFVYASLYLAHQIFGSPLPPPEVWAQLTQATPPGFSHWLAAHGPADVLTADYRRRQRGQDYRLTFLAARSIWEKAGIARFAAFPPLGQLAAKYGLRHRWAAALYYPRHLVERLGEYRQSFTT